MPLERGCVRRVQLKRSLERMLGGGPVEFVAKARISERRMSIRQFWIELKSLLGGGYGARHSFNRRQHSNVGRCQNRVAVSDTCMRGGVVRSMRDRLLEAMDRLLKRVRSSAVPQIAST